MCICICMCYNEKIKIIKKYLDVVQSMWTGNRDSREVKKKKKKLMVHL